MAILSRLKNVTQRVTLYASLVGVVLLVPVMLLTTIDVMGRTALGRPLVPGIFEISEYLLAVFILLGLAYGQQAKAHVRMTIVSSRLPARAQSAVETVTTLLCLSIVSVLVWQGVVVGLKETTVSEILRIPQAPFRLFVSVGAFLLFLEFLIDLVDSVAKLIRR